MKEIFQIYRERLDIDIKKLGKGKRGKRTRSEATETGRVDKTNVVS
jgi:hypothetical protein